VVREMTEREPWLGHWDGCSIQWSDICDCDPDNPVNLAKAEERNCCKAHRLSVTESGDLLCERTPRGGSHG